MDTNLLTGTDPATRAGRFRGWLNLLKPGPLPFVARGLYLRELRAWAVFNLAVGTIEGAIGGVLVKNVFAGRVDDFFLNLCVGAVAGAPAFANILSFVWSRLSHGRSKTGAIIRMQLMLAGLFVLIVIAPLNAWGLALVTTGFIGARIVWSGVLTVRASVWRVNYPRHLRGNVTGRISLVSALVMAIAGTGVGYAMQRDPGAFRWAYLVGIVAALVGAWLYRRVRVRQHRALLLAEREDTASGGGGGLWSPFTILQSNVPFRHYMIAMAVFGTGNLMLMAPLIIAINETMQVGVFQQVLITSTVPLIAITLFVPFWAKLLDRTHVVRFRAIHAWSFASASFTFVISVLTGVEGLLWLGAVFLGLAYAGGMIAWQIGHNDFAPPERSGAYMSVHVTLTGIRGIVAPFFGVLLYEFLESVEPGLGPWALAVACSITVTGAFVFVWLARHYR